MIGDILSRSQSGESYTYDKLEHGEWDSISETSSISPPRFSWRRKFIKIRVGGLSLKTLVGFIGSMTLLMLLAFASTCDEMRREWSPPPAVATQPPTLSPASNSDPSDLRLRIILAADNSGPDLCKTVLSGYANGYPAPIIVNFGRDFNEDDGRLGHSHLGKIDGPLEALEALMSDSAPAEERLTEDDIVLVVDSYDVWFQLPPAILIKRFHAQNALADARLRAAWMPNLNDTISSEDLDPPKQSIIYSVQKKCWPKRVEGKAVRCDAMPPSPLRPDLYGPLTDVDGSHSYRPRHVNSGSIMGTAGTMRRMFRRTVAKALEGNIPHEWSDQAVFAQVLGEQELWRKKAREFKARSADGRFVQDGAAEQTQAVLRDERDEFEYGIGLDFWQELVPPTVYSEADGEYMLLNDTDKLKAASIAHGVYPVRLQGLPEDMDGLDAPVRYTGLDDEAAGMAANATTGRGWAEVPLYADYWTTKVPVAVHHNAHRKGLKAQRLRDWWRLTWFFPHLRQIAEGVQAASNRTGAGEEVARRQALPLATVQGRDAELVYWPPPSDMERPLTRIFDKDRIGTNGLEEAGWDVLCPAEGHEEWWEEIFQDGKGPVL